MSWLAVGTFWLSEGTRLEQEYEVKLWKLRKSLPCSGRLCHWTSCFRRDHCGRSLVSQIDKYKAICNVQFHIERKVLIQSVENEQRRRYPSMLHVNFLFLRCGVLLAGLVGAFKASSRLYQLPLRQFIGCLMYSRMKCDNFLTRCDCSRASYLPVRRISRLWSIEYISTLDQFNFDKLFWNKLQQISRKISSLTDHPTSIFPFQIRRHSNITQTQDCCNKRRCFVTKLLLNDGARVGMV